MFCFWYHMINQWFIKDLARYQRVNMTIGLKHKKHIHSGIFSKESGQQSLKENVT